MRLLLRTKLIENEAGAIVVILHFSFHIMPAHKNFSTPKPVSDYEKLTC